MGRLAESLAPGDQSLVPEHLPSSRLHCPMPIELVLLSSLLMANPQSVIAEAFEKLRRSISEEDAKTFATTELKDVWLAVREIENTQRKRQSVQNLRRVEPFLRGIEQYAKVIEVLCNGTPFMPYVWVCLPFNNSLRKTAHFFSRLRSS